MRKKFNNDLLAQTSEQVCCWEETWIAVALIRWEEAVAGPLIQNESAFKFI